MGTFTEKYGCSDITELYFEIEKGNPERKWKIQAHAMDPGFESKVAASWQQEKYETHI